MTLFTGIDGRTAVDNWPIASYTRGLLEYGERERFNRLMEAQLENYLSPDVFTAYEQETTNGEPHTARAPFCVPVQLAFPRMLAWSFHYARWDGMRSSNYIDERKKKRSGNVTFSLPMCILNK